MGSLASGYPRLGQLTPDRDFTYLDVSSVNGEDGSLHGSPAIVAPDKAPSLSAWKVVRSGTVLYSTIRPYLRNVVHINRDFETPAIASGVCGASSGCGARSPLSEGLRTIRLLQPVRGVTAKGCRLPSHKRRRSCLRPDTHPTARRTGADRGEGRRANEAVRRPRSTPKSAAEALSPASDPPPSTPSPKPEPSTTSTTHGSGSAPTGRSHRQPRQHR